MKMTSTLAALAISVAGANAATLLTETFGTTEQNPMTSPSTTTDAVWNYSGPGGGNSSRLFNPGGVGAGTNSVGWISVVDGSTITTTVSLTSAGSEIADTSIYTLTFGFAAETGTTGRFVTGSVNVTSSTGSVNFISASNGDSSQVLTSFADTFTDEGGGSGFQPANLFTYTFSTTGVSSADTLDVSLTRVGSSDGAFLIYDDVGLDVTAIPEPSSAALLGLGGLALIMRRRK